MRAAAFSGRLRLLQEGLDEVQPWDVTFLQQRLLELSLEESGVHPRKLHEFFTFGAVLDAIFSRRAAWRTLGEQAAGGL